MKEFIQVLKRFVPPYKKYLVWSVVFNILSAILNIFSFMAIIPILQILFKTNGQTARVELMPWSWDHAEKVLSNNANYYVQELIDTVGATNTLLVIGLFLAFMTFLKTGAYFLSSATIIPIRTGVVRDIRNQLYQKITSLSLGFFSEERKGDIIARMSGDVQEIENSIMSSLDMLFKNPILIIAYFTTLLVVSWQLTLFTIVFVPVFGWFMGVVGRRLKANSIKAQGLWSDTMSQVEETLGGLRIIKAFCAEEKMNARFDSVNTSYRNNIMRVNIRQQLAHPMSEFLGTVMIVIVLWFGGTLVLSDNPVISGPKFIYYLVMLYSIINPLKEFSKAGYNIPKGLASMERVDKILMAEVEIKEQEKPVHINDFEHKIELRNVSFAYGIQREEGRGKKQENTDIKDEEKDISLTSHPLPLTSKEPPLHSNPFRESFVGESFGRINKDEAELTLTTLERYFTKIGKQRILEERIDVGVISPYRAQVQYLRRLIKKREFFKPYRHLITVNTVDGFQGQERDVILISLVRANDDGQIGFLKDLRRMNVAITRARMKLIILGDVPTMTRHPFYKKLWEYVCAVDNEDNKEKN